MLGSILLYMGELVSAREHLEQGVALYDPERLRSLTFIRATNLVIFIPLPSVLGLMDTGVSRERLGQSPGGSHAGPAVISYV